MFNYFYKKANILDDFLGNTSNVLRADLVDSGDDYILNVEVAGYTKEDVSLSIDGGYLNINLKAKEVAEEVKYLRNEIVNNDATRKFYVGDLEVTEISASVVDGILSIKFPKVGKAQEKKNISID